MAGNEWFDLPAGTRLAVQQQIADSAAAAALDTATVVAKGNSGSAITVHMADGPHQSITLTASAATITVDSFPATGVYGEVTIELKQDGTGSRTIPTFSPAADYGTAGAPTLTTTAGKVDIIKLFTVDGGTTVRAIVLGKGF